MKEAYQRRTEHSKDDWETPDELFNPLNKVYQFNLDVAANEKNSKCVNFLREAFISKWDIPGSTTETRIWCNPPFSMKEDFLDRALMYRQKVGHIMFLLPNNSRETAWWNELVVPYADLIINLIGRVNFLYKGKPSKQCNFPACLVLYRPRLVNISYGNPPELSWDWKSS